MVGKKEASSEKKNQVIQHILRACVHGKPPRGIFKETEAKFQLSGRTIRRYWSAAKKQEAKGEAMKLVSGKQSKKASKRVILDITLLKSLHYTQRGTIRSLAFGLGCAKSTVGRWVRCGLIRAHTSAIRPDLTIPNKLLRLRFSLEALELDRMQNIIKFRTKHNTIHIDEKWFYMTKSNHRFYLAQGEEEPHMSCKNKKFIQKIMFMCAVTRPLLSDNGQVLFDGKIGIFPFTFKEPAKRKSKNRAAGTMETKPIKSITKQVIKECLITKILPAIISKWPVHASKDIYIQQDNARPHIKDNDPEFRQAASQSGLNIRLLQQPPNSPDTNVNDLGWFRAIQSLQVQTPCKTVDDLLNAVHKSFHELTPLTLDHVFLSLQGCMIEIMKAKGHNNYRIPHICKEAQRREGTLLQNLQVPMNLAMQCVAYLKEMGCIDGLQGIVESLGLPAIEG